MLRTERQLGILHRIVVFTKWLFVRLLVILRQDRRAEWLLRGLTADLATPDTLWLHAVILRRVRAAPELQRQAWERFVARAPEGGRAGYAWLALGDLLAKPPWEDGQGAIAAYQKAEVAGLVIPRLHAYRAGEWDALPCLRSHPDYPFPVVVAVDLEVDPSDGTAPGERVFEVAAVRVKGRTILDTYATYIRRDFRPRKAVHESEWQRARPLHEVTAQVRAFIGEAYVAGHNLRDFDAAHLAGMGVPIPAERIVDTLHLARLLYPDSQYHNLGILCHTHHIPLDADERHTALPDARACAQLLHALGDELTQRGSALVAGVRALAVPSSAFDRGLLRPRDIPADPTLPWALNPAPTPPRALVPLRDQAASPAMTQLLRGSGDALVELDDPDGAYSSAVPLGLRTLITVATSSRLERMLEAGAAKRDAYVLPDPATLLCPQRLRALIDMTRDSEERLRLFCLYQAAHNHDAGTLYPLRLPPNIDDAEIRQLQDALRQACCPNDDAHRATCPGAQAVRAATMRHALLLATHAALLHQTEAPPGDLIIIDDVAELALHAPEHLAREVNSNQMRAAALGPAGQNLRTRLEACIATCVRDFLPRPAFHERLTLSILAPYLMRAEEGTTTSVLDALAVLSPAGADLAGRVRALCQSASQEPASPSSTHAFWLDVWFTADKETDHAIERWAIRGLNADVAQACKARCWQPYQRHIICGPALLPASMGSEFLERSLGVPAGLPRMRDSRPLRSQVWLPLPEALAPAGWLGQRMWAIGAGALLYAWAQASEGALVATLTPMAVSDALTAACRSVARTLDRQVLAHSLGWSTSQIRERFGRPGSRALAFVSPRARQSDLDQPVEVEISGPLRFLNTHDPLVAARMRVFASLYAADGPFNAYLLPQALTELVGRLTSKAGAHVVLDSRLMARGYRDEALHALEDVADVRFIEQPPARSAEADAFLEVLGLELDARGLVSHQDVSDEDLHLILRSLWEVQKFKRYERCSADSATSVSQKDVIRDVLAGNDQLLVVPTGGGKSLCFQLPAVLFADEFPPKVTLVFSPLIALMANQVEELNRKGIFSAVLINSTLSPAQRQEHLRGIQRGDYSIIYIAPEQIHSPGLRRALAGREVALVAIDEAHCLSQWGHDFRTDYFAVKRWLTERLAHKQRRTFPILALTATARKAFEDPEDDERSDQASTVRDIITKLDLSIGEADAIMAPTGRPELEFRVERIEPRPLQCPYCRGQIEARAGEAKCPSCKKGITVEDSTVREAVESAKRDKLFALINDAGLQGLRARLRPTDGSSRERGLVYCAYRTTTEQVAEALTQRFPDLRVRAYHAGMEAPDRQQVLDDFTHDGDKSLDIVVATNAFGMGIDVRRLGFVVHFDSPGTLEAYYQEAGRAGRNAGIETTFGLSHPAQCILLYHPLDLGKQRHLSRQNIVTDHQIRDVFEALAEMAHQVQESHGGQETLVPTATAIERVGAPVVEVIATQHDIAARAGVDEESVGTVLYYLEYHSRANGQPVIERGENANRTWRLRWEHGYEDQITHLPPNSPSHLLLRCFRDIGEFHLSEFEYTAVSAVDLATGLRWSYARLEGELLNLARHRIIAYACDGRVRWKDDAAQARTTLAKLHDDVKGFFKQADTSSRKALSRGEMAYVDLNAIAGGFKSGVEPSRFAQILFALSREDAEPLRVFEHFARALRRPRPGIYECKLVASEKRGGRTIGAIVIQIFQELEQVVDRLEVLAITAEWQRFDILEVEPDYRVRQHLHRWLLLLDVLGLIGYQGDPSLGLALSVIFLQLPLPKEDQLSIDLETLRLKETYTKHKLKQIEAYAALEHHTQRADEFDRYFFADKPLIERLDPNLRTDLMSEQEEVARFDGGYHLVEGAAGSGKTTTLVQHVKHLVYERQVPLERIMVATHFHSAVSRIDKQLEVLKEDGSVALTATIGSFGNQIFTRHRLQLRRGDGRPYYANMPSKPLTNPKASSYNSTELRVVSEALVLVHSGSWPQQFWPEGLRMPRLVGPYAQNAQTERNMLDSFRRLRQQGVFPACVPTAQEVQGLLGKDSEARQYGASERYAAYMTFLQLMGEKRLYTFDDQILFALAILRLNPGVRKEYRRHYEHVIIDEFQDFTRAAALLLLEICGLHPNALLFGDRDQDIRSKTTSAADLFDEFRQKDTCGKPHDLYHNFRSTQEILDLATYVRNWNEPDDAIRAPLIASRGSSGEKPVVLRVQAAAAANPEAISDDHGQSGEDDRLLSSMLDAALEQISRLDETESGRVAIIAADSGWLDQLEHLLIARGISFSLLKHEYTYQAEHVRNALLVYLRLSADSQQDEEMARLLRNCVVPYLDRKQIKALRSIARREGTALSDVLRDGTALDQAQLAEEQRASLEAHLGVIARFTADSRVSMVAAAIETIPNNPISSLKDEEDKFKDFTNTMRDLGRLSIAKALEHVERHVLFLDEHQGNTALCLTTVDHAKSEEFDTVFLLGANLSLSSQRAPDLRREKRRHYVTISRARDRLFLLYDADGQLHPILSGAPANLVQYETWPPEEEGETFGIEVPEDIPF